jgi:hypothetical protein
MAYPLMMRRFLPAGLMGLMIASLLAAFMSTIDTHLNLSSAYVVNDVYRRFLHKGASERHYVAVSRIASVGVMVLSAAVALAYNSIAGLFYFLLAITSGIGLVYILRWFWWRVSAWSEISAMIASGLIAGGLYAAKEYVFPDQLATLTKEAILAVTVAGSTAVWVAVTFLTPPVAQERLVEFYRKVRPYGFWGRVAREAGVEPARGLWRLILAWLAGTVMVLAATIGVGKLLLDQRITIYGAGTGGIDLCEGWLYLAVAALGAAVVAWEVFWRRSDAPPASSEQPVR